MAVVLAAGLLALAAAVIAAVLSSGPRPRYYVAIGASQTLGFQPAGADAQQATDQGYTNDLVAIERARWPGLQLVTFACPGIRMDIALSGRTTSAAGSMAAETASGRCQRSHGSEVGTASGFIRAHPGQVALVTVDLGFPDVTVCVENKHIDSSCVTAALARIRSALPTVVSRLRKAGGASLRVVGLDYEDPFLGYYVGKTDPDPAFSKSSIAVVGRLNRVEKASYARAGVPVAPVAAAFTTGVTSPAHLAGWGTVPVDVKRICTLTWVCSNRNPHPNARGYRTIATVLAATVNG